MSVTPLNTRTKKILEAIVQLYIETTLPVSSQAITQRLRSRVSAATVRNEMVKLDELGMIWQPYTSAGRIPTDEGYRYYIDSLLEVEQLTVEEKELIAGQYPRRSEVFEELLTEILSILSNFSGYTALAFASGLRKILFKRLELVRLQSSKLLVVLVSLEGLVKTVIVQLPYKIEQGELSRISRFLNQELSGLSLEEIKQRLSLRVLAAEDSLFHLLKKAAQILDLTVNDFDKDKLYLAGTSHILGQPEFRNAQKLQAILRTFESQHPLMEIMKEDLDCDGVRVHIGKENCYQDIQECSLVVSNFKIKNRNMGALGIIGPRRMSYARAISTVGYISYILSTRLK